MCSENDFFQVRTVAKCMSIIFITTVSFLSSQKKSCENYEGKRHLYWISLMAWQSLYFFFNFSGKNNCKRAILNLATMENSRQHFRQLVTFKIVGLLKMCATAAQGYYEEHLKIGGVECCFILYFLQFVSLREIKCTKLRRSWKV